MNYVSRVVEKTQRLDPALQFVLVGPFTVRIVRKIAAHPVFLCEVLGVVIVRQISYPSLYQLTRALSRAVRRGELSKATVKGLWEGVVKDSVFG